MKEFKNYVSYSGNKEQLERYAAKLITAGYSRIFEYNKWEEDSICVISYFDGEFGFYNHIGLENSLIFHQDQFTEALKAATEPA